MKQGWTVCDACGQDVGRIWLNDAGVCQTCVAVCDHDGEWRNSVCLSCGTDQITILEGYVR